MSCIFWSSRNHAGLNTRDHVYYNLWYGRKYAPVVGLVTYRSLTGKTVCHSPNTEMTKLVLIMRAAQHQGSPHPNVLKCHYTLLASRFVSTVLYMSFHILIANFPTNASGLAGIRSWLLKLTYRKQSLMSGRTTSSHEGKGSEDCWLDV